MTIFDWPATLLPRHISIRPPRKTAGLTTSLTEFTQAVPVIRPPFGLTMEFDAIFGSDVLAWRALIALLEGRANAVRVPLFDLWYRASDTQIGGGIVSHSDGAYFSDGAGYLTNDLSQVLVTGVQGQRHITADFGPYGRLLEAGLYFGLGDHPYIATGVTWNGTVATIRCSPTLRIDYSNQQLRLKPDMIARLTNDDGGELMLRNLRHGTPTLELEETFDEPLS
ncbi:hypothetical protein SAMN02927924_01703 [Sphingobium faniae]|nr:hypothetical protein SAMN02927924_01703 [Sphingobium faniae]